MFTRETNKKIKMLTVLLLSGVMLSACAGREKPVLSLTAKQAMTKSQVVMVNDYKQLEADIEGSNITGAMGGGLLWALADVAAREEQKMSQENLIEPIKAQLGSENLLVKLKASLSEKLKKFPRFAFKGTEVSREDLGDYISSYNGPEDAIVVLTPKYRLSEDLADLKGEVGVAVYPISSQFKTALQVSEEFKSSVIGTSVNHVITGTGTVSALANDMDLKKQVSESIENKLSYTKKDLSKLERQKFRELRRDAKQTNVHAWTKGDGTSMKQAIETTTKILSEQVQKTLPAMFPQQAKPAS